MHWCRYPGEMVPLEDHSRGPSSEHISDRVTRPTTRNLKEATCCFSEEDGSLVGKSRVLGGDHEPQIRFHFLIALSQLVLLSRQRISSCP